MTNNKVFYNFPFTFTKQCYNNKKYFTLFYMLSVKKQTNNMKTDEYCSIIKYNQKKGHNRL